MSQLPQPARTLVGGEALAAGAIFAKGHGILGFALQALAHERVQRRQPVQQWRGIFAVQWSCHDARVDEGPQLVRDATQLVVFLGRLDDGGEVQPAEAFQLLGLLGNAVELPENLLQELLASRFAELGLLRGVSSLRRQALAFAVLAVALFAIIVVARLDANGQWFQLLLACRGAVAQLLRDVYDEVVHLLELHVGQLVHKGLLVITGPGVVVFVVLEQLLELVVVDVLVFPRLVDAFAQSGAELHGCASAKDPAAGSARADTNNCSAVAITDV
jgi:hypothetical protein